VAEYGHFSGCLDEINLEFVQREATAKLLMKLSIELHLAKLPLLNTVFFLEIFVLIGADLLVITGFIKPIYSQKLAEARITLRLMRP
jgi:hypothetical protein